MRFEKAGMPIILLLAFASFTLAQSRVEGMVLKWDTEPYSQSAHIVRNGVVYYIQVEKTVYQVTRRTTKPDLYLVVGKKIQCRIDGDSMLIPNEKGKEVKYRILGAAASTE